MKYVLVFKACQAVITNLLIAAYHTVLWYIEIFSFILIIFSGEKFAFGHMYVRPHETFHEPSRKFYPNEVSQV